MRKQGQPAVQLFKENKKKFSIFKIWYTKLKQILLKLQLALKIVSSLKVLLISQWGTITKPVNFLQIYTPEHASLSMRARSSKNVLKDLRKLR